MTTVRFQLTSSLSQDELKSVLTDFSSARAENWPTIDADHFEVHHIGENWAEVTEGTEAAWERARYEWSADSSRVQITTLDSKVFGAGGGWTFDFTPSAAGTVVDVELVRTPASFKGKMLASLLSLVGLSSLKKSFAAPLHAI